MGINPGEVLILVLLGIIVFGPEKLPEYARKAGRVVRYLREVANNAQTQLREQLGPEYADLELTDLHPKNMARKILLSEDYAEVRRELVSLRDDVGALQQSSSIGESPANMVTSQTTSHTSAGRCDPVRYDDAT